MHDGRDQLDELDEYWTDEQVAEYLGIRPRSVSSWASRHPEVDRRPRMKASLVVAEKLSAPGRGRRTDLVKKKTGKKTSTRDGTTT